MAGGLFELRRDDITHLEVRAASGKMVPLSTLVEVRDTVLGRPAVIALAGPANRQGRIAAVGTSDELRPFEDDAAVIDLQGKTILPGLIDSHVHFTSTGIKAMAIDFSPVGSIAETQATIDQAARDAVRGQLLYGMGINHYKMPDQQLPGLHEMAPRSSTEERRISLHRSFHRGRLLTVFLICSEHEQGMPASAAVLRLQGWK